MIYRGLEMGSRIKQKVSSNCRKRVVRDIESKVRILFCNYIRTIGNRFVLGCMRWTVQKYGEKVEIDCFSKVGGRKLELINGFLWHELF